MYLTLRIYGILIDGYFNLGGLLKVLLYLLNIDLARILLMELFYLLYLSSLCKGFSNNNQIMLCKYIKQHD